MKEPVLEVRGLSKSFGEIQAVKDLNLTIYQGDVYGFIGPNGAGKTSQPAVSEEGELKKIAEAKEETRIKVMIGK